ncbi:hypothetical protein JCM19232_2594 [Vibrio ishigakensis]|uniref:Lipoprotein n=1 Tax=Vibrio ishigakensis TaxID=1481914 RepID=A0A0B8PLN3_9VIBR|nr:hypothetical protein JCM19232_2594 [Vibrio ishigakensis]
MNIRKASLDKQIKTIAALQLAILMTACASTEPTLENNCSTQGVQESIDEANALVLFHY